METARAVNLSDRPPDVKSRVRPASRPGGPAPDPLPLGLPGDFTHLAATTRPAGALGG
jgi:hypothetical protein